MTKLTFLYANTPLTKRIVKNRDGSIDKHGYPNVANFTSKTVTVKNIEEMFKAVIAAIADKAKPCLLKGTLQRELKNESRAKSTSSNSVTTWACFDLDRAPFTTPEEFMAAMGLSDVSYIVQYSSSYKLNPKDKTLSCHILCMLEKSMQPAQLKAWLMHQNFTIKALRNALTLTNSAGSGLHYGLDVTLCQNDRLLYIAEPTFVNMTSPIPSTERCKLVKKELGSIPPERIGTRAMDALNKEKREIWNQLREDAGMPKVSTKVKQQGEYSVQTGLGQASGYEVFDDQASEFIYYNLMRADGTMGDSRAYYHHRANFELLHSFKGEDSMLLKEVLPERYAELTRHLTGDLSSVSEEGDVMLAFRNSEDSEYYSCLWNAENQHLWLKRVKSKDALVDWISSHGRGAPPFIPTWEITFNPQSSTVVDVDNKTVNTFILPPLLRDHAKHAGKWDNTRLLIEHALGYHKECVEHFLNHLAVVFQHRVKPGTAWVLHGEEGTGKGMLVNVVLKGILGHYVGMTMAEQLDDQFNEWIERALIGFIDEMEVDMLQNKSVSGTLRSLITEPEIPIRKMREARRLTKNYTMFIFSSNKPQPVRIPRNDRRYNVAAFQKITLKTMLRDKFGITPVQFIARLEKELGAFTNYLMTRKACIHTATEVIETEDKRQMQELSMTSAEETADAILHGNIEKLHSFMPDENLMADIGDQNMVARGYAMLIRRWLDEPFSRITRDELGVIFEHCVGNAPRSPNKLTSYLRHYNIHTKKMRANNAVTYGIEVEWKISKQTLAELRDTQPRFSERKTLKRVK